MISKFAFEFCAENLLMIENVSTQLTCTCSLVKIVIFSWPIVLSFLGVKLKRRYLYKASDKVTNIHNFKHLCS